jgi:phosphopentomutase
VYDQYILIKKYDVACLEKPLSLNVHGNNVYAYYSDKSIAYSFDYDGFVTQNIYPKQFVDNCIVLADNTYVLLKDNSILIGDIIIMNHNKCIEASGYLITYKFRHEYVTIYNRSNMLNYIKIYNPCDYVKATKQHIIIKNKRRISLYNFDGTLDTEYGYGGDIVDFVETCTRLYIIVATDNNYIQYIL